MILPQLTYGIDVWANKGKIKKAAKSLHAVIRRAFGLQTKTPTLAIVTEIGIPPLDLYVPQRQDMLAHRAHILNRHTNMSNRWLETSNLPTTIANAQGIDGIKAHTRKQWKERINHKDIRYKGKPRKKYGHVKDLWRADFRDNLYLRATSGWPYQGTDGKRRQCPRGRDVITHTHLMSFCGMVQSTKL